jgi:tRNA A-37 threonylcarbamoyl transferase component Bud32/tetratricopeptide (TPR) repeat protein
VTATPVEPEAAEALEERVARALELRHRGLADWLEQACADDPKLQPLVECAVAAADGLPGVLNSSYSRDLRIGRVIAQRYQLERRLGAGAMGVVYEATDLELKRRVAIKVLSLGLLERERAVQRFEREARAMAAVEHDSVIAIHDRGRTPEGEAFLVMELVAGCQLGGFVDRLSELGVPPDRIGRGELEAALGFALDPRESYVRVVVRWVAELAAGLDKAHAAGIIHRDIKPSNVIVRRDGRAVLLDFGIAHLAASEPVTHAGTSLGTPAYMAPELLGQDGAATPAVDIYGLAALLYCLLALQPPYRGSPQTVLLSLATRDPEPITKHHRGLPRDLAAIVEMGTSRSPQDRYASAAEFEADLRAFLDHRPVVARPIGPVVRLARRLRLSRTGRGAAAALTLAAVLGLGWSARAEWLDRRQAEWLELSRHFPPNFTIQDPQHRALLHERDRQDLGKLLDRAARVCIDPLPTYLLRASFRLDHGDLAGAAADMRHLARTEDSALAAALAQAYAAVPAGQAGHAALNLAGLPEPSTPRDRFLLGYHALRDWSDAGDERARLLLDEDVVRAVPHSALLRLVLRNLTKTTEAERFRAALELHEEVLLHEQRLGTRSAASAHWACYALNLAHDYRGALEAGLESVALAPRFHSNRNNASAAAFALGEYERARELLSEAFEVRPDDPKLMPWLVWSHVAQGDYGHALAAIDDWREAPLGAPESLRGEVEIFRALTLRQAGAEKAELAAALDRAQASFASVVELGQPGPSAQLQSLAQALAADDGESLFQVLADIAVNQPRRLHWALGLLEQHVPEQLGQESTDALRGILGLYEDLVRGDAAEQPRTDPRVGVGSKR